MLNKVMLIGNLGKDPELTYTQSGTARCRFSLATNESYTDNQGQKVDKVEWHNVVVWGKTGENCSKYLEKGRSVFVEGKIQTRSWDDEKSGEKRYMTEVNAFVVKFLGGGKGDGGHRGQRNDAGQQGGDHGGEDHGGAGEPEDDIPF